MNISEVDPNLLECAKLIYGLARGSFGIEMFIENEFEEIAEFEQEEWINFAYKVNHCLKGTEFRNLKEPV